MIDLYYTPTPNTWNVSIMLRGMWAALPAYPHRHLISARPAVQRGRTLEMESQSEETRARLLGPYYGANEPAPGTS